MLESGLHRGKAERTLRSGGRGGGVPVVSGLDACQPKHPWRGVRAVLDPNTRSLGGGGVPY